MEDYFVRSGKVDANVREKLIDNVRRKWWGNDATIAFGNDKYFGGRRIGYSYFWLSVVGFSGKVWGKEQKKRLAFDCGVPAFAA